MIFISKIIMNIYTIKTKKNYFSIDLVEDMYINDLTNFLYILTFQY